MSAPALVRAAVDVGGTFTDLVVEDAAGRFEIHKAASTPDDPVRGMLDALELVTEARGTTLAELLSSVELFVFATTRATNAIINGDTARTALLVTEGHPDILLWREGTRVGTFDYGQENPEPYVSRALTFEVPERVDARGEVVKPLDEGAVARIVDRLRELEVEAVAVCLLWSIMDGGAHERRVGELLERQLPGVPYTLSHALTPAMREYRRASAASIDASLKPLMTDHLGGLAESLRGAGLRGRLMMMTSSGGVQDLGDVAAAPIHSIASGPAAAPVSGRHYAALEGGGADTAIVTDAGGTSYDVSLVRRGVIPWTRETKLGVSPYGQVTGFPSVDVKSIGAGGGTIASVDSGGLLHVGPRSAGAVPGPACYGRGGAEPTVTDACLVVGYLDPEYFLGGRMRLDADAAADAVDRLVARPLGMSLEEAAAAILELQVEHMVGAIESITLSQGVDPRSAVLVGGGGSAGFYSVAIARRLRCPRVVMPDSAAALSAMGALLSDLTSDHLVTHPTTTAAFDHAGVNDVLARLRADCDAFAARVGSNGAGHEVSLSAEARYRDQVWEIEVPLSVDRFSGAADVRKLRHSFDRAHEDVLAHFDPGSDVEVITWRARVRCRLREAGLERAPAAATDRPRTSRPVYFPRTGQVEAAVVPLESLEPDETLGGPAIVESATTAIIVDPGARAARSAGSAIVLDPGSRSPDAATKETG